MMMARRLATWAGMDMLEFSDPATIGGTVLVAGLVIFVIRTIMVEEKPVEIEVHRDQLAWLEEKAAKFCDSGGTGKAARCIIDYLREEPEDAAKKVLSEKQKYSTDLAPIEKMMLHELQFQWLEEKGFKVGKGEEGQYTVRLAPCCRSVSSVCWVLSAEWRCWLFIGGFKGSESVY